MQLELEQAECRLAIEREPQLLQDLDQPQFGGHAGRRQPADRIAANRLDALGSPFAADARRREFAPPKALQAAVHEFPSQRFLEKIVMNA